jgi:3-methyl-2-oxobutanoate hydroxymethyltransferase
MARLIDPLVDAILVGDSAAMVVHGHPTTLPVTVEQMIVHTQAVMRGAARALVVVDLPFGSYEAGPEAAFATASAVMKATGASAVKLEGGEIMAPTVAFLTARGIPVMGHVGLQPQAVQAKGYRTAGREQNEWPQIKRDAALVEAAGAFAIVLEGMVEPLAAQITREARIPTIGIGASAQCDGQILVLDDMLGLTMAGRTPSFVKRYADLDGIVTAAVTRYAGDVRAREFPADAHTVKPD